MKFSRTKNEAARLEALHQYQIVDTEPEPAFDDIALLAAQICETPIALINLVDEQRQWFKSKVGLDVNELPRDIGLCSLCLEQADVVVIPDTLIDEQSRTNPIVTSAPYVRFYAGVPLMAANAEVIGTLCVVDYVPRQLSLEQIAALQALSRQIVSQLELRRNLAELARMTIECKRAEEAISQSEERYRSVVKAMQEGIVLQHSDGRIYACNASAERILGLSVEQMMEKTSLDACWRAIHEDGSPFPGETHPAMITLRTGKPCSNVVMGIHKPNGKLTWISINSQPLFIPEDPSPYAVVVSLSDITESKQAQEHLRWQEALLRSMTDASPLAFYVVDNRTDAILYFNHQFCKIWGIEHLEEQMMRQQLKNQDLTPYCLAVIADVLGFAQSCKPLQSEENRCVVEDEIPFIDGRTIRRFSSQIRNQQDQYFGRLYIFEDITERKQAENKIREQATLLNITTDAILVRDLDNKILLWNQGAERLYGWKAQEILGKDVNKILYKDLSQLEEAIKIVIHKGEWQGELRKVNKQGKEIIVESRWTLVRDEHLNPKSILTVDTNITEKKQLEAQFLRAQRLESIGTLAGGIAHDLNNVLAPILMSAQLLQMKVADERNQQILKTIENNAKRGAALVKQVLSFARGVEGKRTIVQFRHLISETQQIVKETFPKSIVFSKHIAPDLWAVLGDATQLHQVLMNLCVNARDAMLDGGTLKISAANIFIDVQTFRLNVSQMNVDAKVGSYLVITVEDTGCGIAPEILDRIFEPFFTTKDLGKGTGLGLSTVSSIIKSHGGFLDVYSEIGEGTKFKIYLPAVEVPQTQQVQSIELPTGKGELILVVDDEAAIREFTKMLLETYKYNVITASDGVDALAQYVKYKHEISAVLMDMMMPHMEGSVAIRTLQKINSNVNIIATSGLASTDRVTATTRCGVKAFLSKPYTTEELLTTIHQVLNQNNY